MAGMSARGRERDESREQEEGQTNKKTTSAIHTDSRHLNEMALLLLERGFRMLQLSSARAEAELWRWTSSIRLAQSQSLRSRSSVATWQLPLGSCQLSAVGYQIAKSRAVFHTYAPATVKPTVKATATIQKTC